MRKAVAYYQILVSIEDREDELRDQQAFAMRIANAHRAILDAEFTELEKDARQERTQIVQAIQYAKRTYALLIIAKLGSLERNGAALNFLRESGVRFIVADAPSVGDKTIGALADAAKKRSEMASHRIKVALEVVKAKTGKGEAYISPRTGRTICRLGNPNGAAALHRAGKGTGAALEAIKSRADSKARDLLPTITSLRAAGHTTLSALSDALNAEGVLSPRGGRWHPSSVRNLLMRTISNMPASIDRPSNGKRLTSRGAQVPAERSKSPQSSLNFSPHELISRIGLDEAKRRAATKFERSCIDAAAMVLAKQDDANDLSYGTMLATIMPHRRIEDRRLDWRHETPEAVYTIIGGKGRNDEYFGVPYGSKARVLLTFFFGKAVLAQNSIFEVGESKHDWLRALGYSKLGGATYTLIVEQAERLGTSRLTVAPRGKGKSKARTYNFIREAYMIHGTGGADTAKHEPLQDEPEYLENSRHELFVKIGMLPIYKDYKSDAFPIRWSAMLAIGNNSAAIDIYLELCRTLPRLRKVTLLSWDDIKQRSSAQYANGHDMRRRYLKSLKLALAVYPQAKAQIQDEGILLYPSAPPIEASATKAPSVDR